MNKAIIVLGMHRSGTSALTGALQRLGVSLGGKLAGPQPEVNEQGFFEHLALLNLHEEILQQEGAAWDNLLPLTEGWVARAHEAGHADRLVGILRRDFGFAPVWAVKDPRLCRLFPLWPEALQNLNVIPHFVISLRHPGEVAGSLARRDGIGADKAAWLWLDHTFAALDYAMAGPVALLRYEDLLSDPGHTMSKTADALGLNWPVAQEQAGLDSFISSEERHHEAPQDMPDGLPGLAVRTYQLLSKNGLRADVAVQRAEFETLKAEASGALADDLAAARDRLRQDYSKIRALEGSLSWRATRPLRGVLRLLGMRNG